MQVRIFGRERWDLTQLRRHFGIVAAGPFGSELPGERTAVTTGLDAVIAGFFSASTLWPNLHVTAEMRERAVEALERMEAIHLAQQLVGEMSAGEKRRILIARALVHRPRQLLLDEPSNALDLAAQRELRDTLRRLARREPAWCWSRITLATFCPRSSALFSCATDVSWAMVRAKNC